MDFADRIPRQVVSVDSAALLDGLLRVSQAFRLRFNDWLGQYDLNDGRHAVLSSLSESDNDGCSQADLADRLGQSESNISTLIERMQRDGLVTRLRSQADRRKRILLLTPEGRATLDGVEAGRTTWARQLLKNFSDDDRGRMFALLQQLASNLESPLSIPEVSDVLAKSSNGMTNQPFGDAFDPSSDPQSPQFALRQMLLALSSQSGVESRDEKDAA